MGFIYFFPTSDNEIKATARATTAFCKYTSEYIFANEGIPYEYVLILHNNLQTIMRLMYPVVQYK